MKTKVENSGENFITHEVYFKFSDRFYKEFCNKLGILINRLAQ